MSWGELKKKRCRLNGYFYFVSAQHWSARFVACRTTLGVGGLCIFVVAVLRIGALPTAVGADVATCPAVVSATATRFGRLATQLSDSGCKLGGFHQGLNWFGIGVSKLGGEISDGGGEGGDGLAIMGGGGCKIGNGLNQLLLVGGVGMI